MLPISLALAVTAIAVAISSRDGASSSSARFAAQSARMQKVLAGIPQHGITLGDPSAPVTVTEYGDLQCPFCDAYTLALFPKVVSSYVKPGLVKMVFRNMSFVGPDSVIAGRAAAAAGMQNKLWSFIDAFYYNQGYENSGYVTPAFLRRVASLVPGLSVNRLMGERQALATLATLRSVTLLARSKGVTATPTFLIQRPGGSPARVVGFANLTSAIDAALAARR